jgi:capsid protein
VSIRTAARRTVLAGLRTAAATGLRWAASKLAYAAAESSPRRRLPPVSHRSEDAELPAAARAKLITGTRDLRRNFATAAWCVRKHLDYVATFGFQARTGDPTLNKRIEEIIGLAARARAADRAGRHPLRRMVRILEALRTLDGDVLLVKLADGRAQIIEGDRLRSPTIPVPGLSADAKVTQGVHVDEAGAALGYCVHARGESLNSFTFERLVPAAHCFHHGYFDRADQTRGVTPLSAALNTYRDMYEATEYALAKAKVAQLFGLKFKRAESGDLPPPTGADGTADNTKVDFGQGNWVFDLDPGDDVELIESATPSTQFQSFIPQMTAIALKALDIPLSFWDEAHSTYSGSRQAWIQYDQSAETKREDNRDLLNDWTAWQLARRIADGELELPSGLSLDRLPWEWIAQGVPWIDPLKEVQADRSAVEGCLDSEIAILRRRNRDWRDVIDERADFLAYAREREVPVLPFVPVPIVEAPQPTRQTQQEDA